MTEDKIPKDLKDKIPKSDEQYIKEDFDAFVESQTKDDYSDEETEDIELDW